jgi:hypothetical protein
MLRRHVSVARATMAAPWDAERAARVLERAVRARRSSRPKRPAGWVLALAAASLGAVLLARVPVSNGDTGVAPSHEPRPVLVGSPSESLDGGKHAG